MSEFIEPSLIGRKWSFLEDKNAEMDIPDSFQITLLPLSDNAGGAR